MAEKAQYYIALIPHLELREAIRALQEEMKTRFQAQRALRSPAHITLQIPFRQSPEEEANLLQALTNLAAEQHSFRVGLSGFGCFAPKVLFLKIEMPQAILALRAIMEQTIVKALHLTKDEVSRKYHPHLTIAAGDLSEADFPEIWATFENRPFQATFVAKSLFLLKHNGKNWDIYKEFPFGSIG